MPAEVGFGHHAANGVTIMQSPFLPDLLYLAEGGIAFEMSYDYGYDLPPILDNQAAMDRYASLYRAFLNVALRKRMGVMLGGWDCGTGPDWPALLGRDAAGRVDYQNRSIAFLKEIVEPYREHLPHILVSGVVASQGGADWNNQAVTQAAAEQYHGPHVANLALASVDLVQALSFTSTNEAIGVIRAAAAQKLPIILSFTIQAASGWVAWRSFREIIEQVDRATDSYALFYGINCTHPLEFETLLGEQGEYLNRIGLLRPDASTREMIARTQLGYVERGDPSDLARRIGDLAARLPALAVFGGCCGTCDEHLELIARAVTRS